MSEMNKEHLRAMSKSSLSLIRDGNLDSEIWQLAGVPLGDGNFWMYQDRNARIILGDTALKIDISKFSASHDTVQIFDNPKQLYLTKKGYGSGPRGMVGFSCRMQANLHNGNLNDYRDGFCAFNVLDFATGMVFDIVSNGSKVWVIYERLYMPGITTPEQAFTNVIPIEKTISPTETLGCSIIYNNNANAAEYYIDGVLIFRADKIPAKVENLQTGFGIITLHPIENGKSVSCKGQGAQGEWSDFAYYFA